MIQSITFGSLLSIFRFPPAMNSEKAENSLSLGLIYILGLRTQNTATVVSALPVFYLAENLDSRITN